MPKHIWSKIANPVTYPDTNPVGTGAYTVSTCTPQNITYMANPHYWQPGKPKIAKVQYPAFTLQRHRPTPTWPPARRSGAASSSRTSRPSTLSKSPNNHYWFPPVANVSLIPNLTEPAAEATSRSGRPWRTRSTGTRSSTIGEYGYEPAANQTDIVTPTFTSWLDTSQARPTVQLRLQPGQGRARSCRQAGYKQGSQRDLRLAAGKQLSFSVINNGGLLRLGRRRCR